MNGAERLRLALVVALLGCVWFALPSLAIVVGTGEVSVERRARNFVLLLFFFAPSSALVAVFFRGLRCLELGVLLRWIFALVSAIGAWRSACCASRTCSRSLGTW